MKKTIGLILIVLVGMALWLAAPARAIPDLALGERTFNSNCASCHKGGLNVVMAQKTLQKEALEQFGMNSMPAIMAQVRNGKGGMPAFGGRLSDDQIESVAAYVLDRAESGW